MPGSIKTQSDSNGIAIVSAPPDNPQSSTSKERNPQSDTPHSPLPSPNSPSRAQQPGHFSILQYAQVDEQNVRVKPLPRAFHPQPLNYDQRVLLLAFFTGLPGAVVGLILLWKGAFDTKTQWTLTVFIVTFWL